MRVFLERSLLLGVVVAAACAGDSSPAAPESERVLDTVTLSVADTSLEVGQFTLATASLRDQFGAPFDATVVFTSSAPDIADVIPEDNGRIRAFSAGTTSITASAGGKRTSQLVTVTFPPIFINEVVLHGPSGDGWVELYNPTARPVDLTGWTITNANVFQSATLPAGAIVPAGGFFVIEERSFPLGLPEREAAHLFSRFGVQSDAFAWGHDPGTSFGRCPDGESGLGVTSARTRGAPNLC
jgi:hypothetical protein